MLTRSVVGEMKTVEDYLVAAYFAPISSKRPSMV